MMKNLLYCVLIRLFVNVCLSQSKTEQTFVPDKLVKLDTLKMKALKLESDTVYVRSFTTSPSTTKPFWEQNGSWIAIFIVGLLAAWVNWQISKATKKSNRESLEIQLENNQQILNAQLQTSKEIALEQIKNAQNTSQKAGFAILPFPLPPI